VRELLPEHADAIALAIFAVLGLVALASGLAVVTRRNPIAAIAWLVVHFVATACLYVVLDSQFLAAVQVLVYAGAIMVLFLFIIMMLELAPAEERGGPGWGRWGPVLLLSTVILGCTVLLMTLDPRGADGVPRYYASPRTFGYALFHEYALAVEIVSFQLLFAAVGAFYVGKADRRKKQGGGR
jgi:NADH-quinone oxidoreductase subunit J